MLETDDCAPAQPSTGPADRPPRRRITDHLTYKLVEKVLFDSRYLLVVAYLSVTFALVAYIAFSAWQCVKFGVEIFAGDEAAATIGMLSALDSIMIANVVYFIVAGSYTVYVKERIDDLTFEAHQERPQALRHLSPGSLKEKMAASLIGVSSVNLLQILINVSNAEVRHANLDWFAFTVKVVIHAVLLVGLVAFAWVNAKEEEGGAGTAAHPAEPGHAVAGEHSPVTAAAHPIPAAPARTPAPSQEEQTHV